MASNPAWPRSIAASDRSLLLSFGGAISLQTHQQVAAVIRSLQTAPIPGVSNIHPAYCSILLVFDPLAADHETVEREVLHRLPALDSAQAPAQRTVELPVCYGGEHGPDLDELARERGLTPDRVIALHSAPEYIAYFVGFVPGFAYLGGLPAELASPRLATPRPKVPPGSVGIAGAQTGVYPFETPGGWRLIGRTPLDMFRADQEPMTRLALGDRVRFVPITPARYLGGAGR